MNYIIKHEGDEWVLYDSTGKRVLGRHKSEESAMAQEKAIQSSKVMCMALRENTGERIRVEQDAGEALVSIDEKINVMYELRACLEG